MELLGDLARLPVIRRLRSRSSIADVAQNLMSEAVEGGIRLVILTSDKDFAVRRRPRAGPALYRRQSIRRVRQRPVPDAIGLALAGVAFGLVVRRVRPRWHGEKARDRNERHCRAEHSTEQRAKKHFASKCKPSIEDIPHVCHDAGFRVHA